jgi:hypothetical protein
MQNLIIDGNSVDPKELWRYSLRWYVGNGGCVPTIYCNGKRVTKAWKLELAVEEQEDVKGASANTA